MRAFLRIALIAFTVWSFCLVSSPFSYASKDSDLGRQYCESNVPSKNKKTDQGSDPCHEAELKDKAAEMNYITAGVYGVAAAICAVQCGYGAGALSADIGITKITPCSASTFAGTASGVLGSIMVSEKGADITSIITGGLAPAAVFGTITAGFSGKNTAFWNTGATGSKLENSGLFTKEELAKEPKQTVYVNEKDGTISRDPDSGGKKTEIEHGGESDDADDKGDTSACVSALSNAVFVAVNYYNAKQAEKAADEAREKKVQDVGVSEIIAMKNSGSNEQKPDAPLGEQLDPKINRDDAKKDNGKLTAEKLASSAIESGFAEPLRDFQKLTGKPATDLFNSMLNGVNPLEATTALAGSNFGNDLGQNGALLARVGEKVADAAKDDLNRENNKLLAKNFGSDYGSSAARKSGGGSKADPLAGLQDVLAGLVPKKPEDGKKPLASAGLGFGKNAAGSRSPTSEGLHSADKSLFEIVGGRYQVLSKDFLHTGNIIPKAASGQPQNIPGQVVPKNLYLRN